MMTITCGDCLSTMKIINSSFGQASDSKLNALLSEKKKKDRTTCWTFVLRPFFESKKSFKVSKTVPMKIYAHLNTCKIAAERLRGPVKFFGFSPKGEDKNLKSLPFFIESILIVIPTDTVSCKIWGRPPRHKSQFEDQSAYLRVVTCSFHWPISLLPDLAALRLNCIIKTFVSSVIKFILRLFLTNHGFPHLRNISPDMTRFLSSSKVHRILDLSAIS